MTYDVNIMKCIEQSNVFWKAKQQNMATSLVSRTFFNFVYKRTFIILDAEESGASFELEEPYLFS